MNKSILMFLYGPLDTDGRVLRCLSVVEKLKFPVTILTTESKKNFSNELVNHVVLSAKFGGLKEYFHFVCQCYSFALKNKNNFGSYYCHDYFTTLIGYLLSLTIKKKIIYDAHELLLRNRNDKVSIRDKTFIFFERIFIRKAFYVITANEERARIIKYVYKLKNVTWVLNITDVKRIGNMSEIKKYSPNEDFYIAYQGYLTEGRKLSFFVKAMEFLPKNIKLMLIGGGQEDFYHKMIVDMNLGDRVIMTGYITNKDMLEKLKQCNLGIISYQFTDLNNLYCSPNKVFEYAAMNLPMISTAQPFMKKILVKYKIGETFRIDDYHDFKSKIESIINTDFKTSYFDRFLSDYNFLNEGEKYEMVFKQL